MPVPMWIGQINKRFFNRLELKRGVRPVITHIGRSSGTTFRTPLDAHAVDGGYVFVLMYGSGCDWCKNVLAAGTATLTIGEETYELISPRVITKDEAWELLPDSIKAPPAFLKVTEYLRMDLQS